MAVIQANRESIDDRFSVLGFTVRTENPLFEIGLATDPELLKAENRQRRTASNFFSSKVLGASQSRRGEAVYLVPPSVVARFIGQPKLYFGLATYNEGDRSRPVSVNIPDRGNMYVSLSGLTERGLRRTARSDGSSGYGSGGNGNGLAWGGDALASTTKPNGNGAATRNASGNGNGAAATTAPASQPASYSDGYSDDLWQQQRNAAPASGNGNAATNTPVSPGNDPMTGAGAPVAAQAYGGGYGSDARAQQQPPQRAPMAQPLLVSSYYQPTDLFDALRTQIGFFVTSAMWYLGVTDTTVPPHSAICQVRRPDGSAEGALHGSAFFIAPRLLLTAAHVVDGQGELIIVPGKNGGSVSTATEPFGRFRVSTFSKHPSYRAGSSDFDMALIHVPAASAAQAGNTFELVEELTQSRPEGVVVCGYAARWYADDVVEHFVNATIDPNRQHLHGGYVRSLPTDETFDYDLQTLGGTSGSPVYWIEDGARPRAHMVGVHVAAHSETTNLGCRITPAKLGWIRSTASTWGQPLTFSLGAARGTTRALDAGSSSAMFTWPAAMAPGNPLVNAFVDAYNARIDSNVTGEPAPDPTQLRSFESADDRARAEALRNLIPRIAAALQTDSGRHEVSEAILMITTAASLQAFEQIHDRLPATFYAPISTDVSEPPPAVSDNLTIPRALPYLSRRIGMFMAWVDAAIQQATSDTSARIAYQKQQWEGIGGLLGAGSTMIGMVPGLGTGATIVGLAVQGILSALAPDFDRQYSSFSEAMQAVRAKYQSLAATVLKGLIQQQRSATVTVGLPLHPDVQAYLDTHAAHALLGWQDELAFLGVGMQPAAMSLGAPRGVYARAQEIITPFYDPADAASALTSQADAFSLAREEWFAGVPNTTIFPHSAICLLEMRDGSGNIARGTGCYIGRNRILTCGHNLYGQASVDIIPGNNGQGVEPFGRCTVTATSWRIPASYGGSNPAYDLAVIDDVPIAAPGDRWFEVLEELNQSRPEGVVVCGYSSRSTKVPELTAAIDGFKQHLHAGYIAALGAGDSTFDYPILTLKRASGSPVYYISARDGVNKACIVGVHTGSATEDLNRGCRLSNAKIDWIQGRTTTLALAGNRYGRALALEEDPQDAKGISEAIPDETYATEQSYRQARALDAPQAEYPAAARFAPAYSGNYRTMASQRTIDRIVIHITDGGSRINGTIGWFQNPDQRNSRNEHITVSAHYVIGRDGEVVQMVRHNDVAWHASSANSHSIGIEHVANKRGLDPTEEEYQASSRLVAWLCAQYNLPVDREHVVGHQEASPRDNHDCPSKLWNWDHFMDRVRAAALPAPTAQGLGSGRRALSRAQEIITPFYDPSSPASALTCQDNAFSLAREEWFVGVDDTHAFPHSAICQLLMTDSAGNGYGGTGFYIGRNRILTCAHNLHGMANVTVVPGQNGAAGKPFGQTTLPSSAWRIAPRYSGSGNWENDLAVIDNVPIAAPNGQWFEFLNATPSERLPIVVCGYSGASRAVPELTAAIDGDKQHLHGGYAASQSNGEVLEYPIMTLQGASGSPVYTLDRSSGQLQALICAVHVTGQPAARGLNGGCFITPGKIDWIEGRASSFALGAGPASARALAGEAADYPVGLIPQPNKDACWAAAMAMLLSWRRKTSTSPETLANEVGGSLASSYDWDLLEAVRARYGFEMVAQPSNTSLYHAPQQWADWLNGFGPLWVVIVGAPHAVVIAGIRGNLADPASVQVKVLNPWDTRVAFDSDPVTFHPANYGYEDWLSFNQFAGDFGNMAQPDYGNWRVLHLPATAAGAQGLSARAMRLAAPPPLRSLQAAADFIGGTGDTREPVEPSRVPNTRMGVLRGSAGATRWSLDQLEGQKAPAVPGPPVSQSTTTDVNIELGAWPAIEGQAAPLPLTASFRTTAQGSVGDVQIRAGTPADLVYGVEVVARIEDDSDVGNVAAVRVTIDYRFNGFAQGAPAARIELRLLGDGRYERVNRWLTTSQAA